MAVNIKSMLSLDLDIRDEQVFMKIMKWEIIDHNDGKQGVSVNMIGMQDSMYQEFIKSIQFLLNFLLRYINTLTFDKGIKLPLYMMEVYSKIDYVEDAMFVKLNLKLDDSFTINNFKNMFN